MGKFIMLVGLPASGKSSYARDIFDIKYTSMEDNESRGIHYGVLDGNPNSCYVSSDDIRRAQNDAADSKSCFNVMLDESIRILRQGGNVLYDATNLQRKYRKHTLDFVKKCTQNIECVLFAEPYDVCLERNSKRDSSCRVPDDKMFKMLKTFNVPMYQEGFKKITVIRNTPFEKAKYTYANLLKACQDFDQENEHHSLTLDEHLLHAASDASFLCPVTDPHYAEVCSATRYHDIGKLFTKTFIRPDGKITEDAHYYSHENVGAYYYLSYADERSFEDTDSLLFGASLIDWHMRPYLALKPSKRELESIWLGEDFVRALLYLHKADVAAH